MYLIADEGQQVYIRDTDPNITWRNAHLDVRAYANGQHTAPNPTDLITWQTYILRHRANVTKDVAPQLLPAQTQVDLIAALDGVSALSHRWG